MPSITSGFTGVIPILATPFCEDESRDLDSLDATFSGADLTQTQPLTIDDR